MSAHPHSPSDVDTRRRLLEVAGEVFAEHGFRAATVRDICQRAGANVAAINYHFGDKESLYREVLASSLCADLERYPSDMELGQKPSAEERLHAFVRSFLLRMLSGDKPQWLMKLMSREMIEPTGALDQLIESVHRPLFTQLAAIVADLGGPHMDEATRVWCAHAIIAQCVFYRHAQAVIVRMGSAVPNAPAEIDRLAEQVTRFSLGGIRQRARDVRKDNP